MDILIADYPYMEPFSAKKDLNFLMIASANPAGLANANEVIYFPAGSADNEVVGEYNQSTRPYESPQC